MENDTVQDLNTYRECEACGGCCTLTLIAMTQEEAYAIVDYIRDNDVHPRDLGPYKCPFVNDEGKCIIYPVRSETCRLYHCKVPRTQILAQNPQLRVDDDKPYIDMRRAFLHGDFRDPRDIDYVGEGLIDENDIPKGWY